MDIWCELPVTNVSWTLQNQNEVICISLSPFLRNFPTYLPLLHTQYYSTKKITNTWITLLCSMATWPTWAVRSQPSEQCTRTDVLWFSTLSTIRTAPAKMHLICFNQYVDSTPDSHLDSSMFGKHSSVTNDRDNVSKPRLWTFAMKTSCNYNYITLWCCWGHKTCGTSLNTQRAHTYLSTSWDSPSWRECYEYPETPVQHFGMHPLTHTPLPWPYLLLHLHCKRRNNVD